jgi:hypothetical protein
MGEYLAVLAVDGWSCLRVGNGSYDPPFAFFPVLCFDRGRTEPEVSELCQSNPCFP